MCGKTQVGSNGYVEEQIKETLQEVYTKAVGRENEG